MTSIVRASAISLMCLGGHPGHCHIAKPLHIVSQKQCLAGATGWTGAWANGKCEVFIQEGMTMNPMPPCQVTFLSDGSKQISNCDLGDPTDVKFLHSMDQR